MAWTCWKWPILRKAALSSFARAARRLAQVASPGPFRVRVSESPPRGARLVNCAGIRAGACASAAVPHGEPPHNGGAALCGLPETMVMPLVLQRGACPHSLGYPQVLVTESRGQSVAFTHGQRYFYGVRRPSTDPNFTSDHTDQSQFPLPFGPMSVCSTRSFASRGSFMRNEWMPRSSG